MEFDVAAGVTVLERTPGTLRAMLTGLGDEWLHATEGPNTWSPFLNVAHMIHGERTDWIPRAKVILAQGADRKLPPFDMTAHIGASQGVALADLLDEFARLRAANLVTLAGFELTDAKLSLRGEHPELGLVTLRQHLATWVAHDLGHIAQISRVMAKQYRDAVGPWRQYLPVMDR
jgi:hypothetical protein